MSFKKKSSNISINKSKEVGNSEFKAECESVYLSVMSELSEQITNQDELLLRKWVYAKDIVGYY